MHIQNNAVDSIYIATYCAIFSSKLFAADRDAEVSSVMRPLLLDNDNCTRWSYKKKCQIDIPLFLVF